MPRLLLALPQLPNDPASGAARSLTMIAEILHAGGYDVWILGTNESEGTKDDAPTASFQLSPIKTIICNCSANEPGYDQEFDYALYSFKPDFLLTYGCSDRAVCRRRRAQANGVKVVFGLRNLGYLYRGAFTFTDAILTPSKFITNRYLEVLNTKSTPLPLPVKQFERDRVPYFFTIVNPSREKGLVFLAALMNEVKDVQFLVVESRGTYEMLVKAGLKPSNQVTVMPPQSNPWEFYRSTRVVLMPSLWEEPAGRVAAEAIVNGIPVISSGRGGLEETMNGGGFVLPIHSDMRETSNSVPWTVRLEPWVELILELLQNDEFYFEASKRAREAGKIYDFESVSRQYLDWFGSL